MENKFPLHEGREVSDSASVIEPCDQWGPGSVLGEGGGGANRFVSHAAEIMTHNNFIPDS